MPDLLAADLSHFWPTHSASAHTGTHNARTHILPTSHSQCSLVIFQLHISYCSISGKKGFDILFSCTRRNAPNKDFLHFITLCRVRSKARSLLGTLVNSWLGVNLRTHGTNTCQMRLARISHKVLLTFYITRAYIKCKRASLRSRAHNDILLDVTAHVCIIIP